MATDKRGVSARLLQRQLGLGYYEITMFTPTGSNNMGDEKCSVGEILVVLLSEPRPIWRWRK